jgi:hypothetical protein
LIEKPKGKKPLGKTRHRWEYFTMDLKEIGWGRVDQVHVAKNKERLRALVNTIMNVRVPKEVGNFLTI